MASDETHDDTIYAVVTNHEMQYSIWPNGRPIPVGWQGTSYTGTRQDCLAHIDEVWVDMRPLSLQRSMTEPQQAPSPEPQLAQDDSETLVQRLSRGMHPVELSLRPDASIARLRERLERGYVLICFTETRGRTELGVRLDPQHTDLRSADFEQRSGHIHLEGTLELDFVPIRCIADIDLSSFLGQGHITLLGAPAPGVG